MMRVNFKKSPLRIASLPVFLLLSLMAMTRTSLACDCVTAPENESFRNADLVFEGELIRIAEVDHRTVYTFAVSKALKGPVEREVIITDTGTNCDAQFWPEVIYRVYARRFDGKFTSGQCSGNKTLKVKKRPG
jgi:hypothetical protein